MPNIRIKDIPTTASASSSTDFLALDGSANGTRKLNAYSPTFGGNLTVSGTGASTFGGTIRAGAGSGETLSAGSVDVAADIGIKSTQGIVQGNARIVTFTSGNTTLAGNLTVSGTGTSSFAGLITRLHAQGTDGYLSVGTVGKSNQVLGYNDSGGTLYGVGTGKGYIGNLNAYDTVVTDGTYALATFSNTTGNFATKGNLTVSGGSVINGTSTSVYYFGTPSNNYLFFDGSSLFARVGGTDRLTIPASTGNLLVGTTTDGGQKLQVNGTANFSNAGSSTIANFTNSANADFQIVLTASTSAKIGPSTPTSLILQTNGTTALTLDSSQNATFAGNVKVTGTLTANSTSAAVLSFQAGQAILTSFGANTSTAGAFVLQSVSSNASVNVNALVIDSSQNATFAGAIAIGNTVNTVSPTSPNRTVTIVIGGTTYYLAAKTTND